METNQLITNEELIPADLSIEDIEEKGKGPWIDHQWYHVTIVLNEDVRKVPRERFLFLMALLRSLVNNQKLFMTKFFQYRTNAAYKEDKKGQKTLFFPTNLDNLTFLHITPKIQIAKTTGYLHMHMLIKYSIKPTYGLSFGINVDSIREYCIDKIGHDLHIDYSYDKSNELAIQAYDARNETDVKADVKSF